MAVFDSEGGQRLGWSKSKVACTSASVFWRRRNICGFWWKGFRHNGQHKGAMPDSCLSRAYRAECRLERRMETTGQELRAGVASPDSGNCPL